MREPVTNQPPEVNTEQEVTMLDKLKQAFADSDWDTVDLILLPRDEDEADALLENIPEEQQQAWQKHMTDEARELLGLRPFDDGTPLCDSSATIQEEDGTETIPW